MGDISNVKTEYNYKDNDDTVMIFSRIFDVLTLKSNQTQQN